MQLTVADEIKTRQAEIARINVTLRAAKPAPPDIEKLREALTFRVEDWKATLREQANRHVARLVLRRVLEPIVLHDESERPDWIPYGDWVRKETGEDTLVFVPWESTIKPSGLLDGLIPTSGYVPNGIRALQGIAFKRIFRAA